MRAQASMAMAASAIMGNRPAPGHRAAPRVRAGWRPSIDLAMQLAIAQYALLPVFLRYADQGRLLARAARWRSTALCTGWSARRRTSVQTAHGCRPGPDRNRVASGCGRPARARRRAGPAREAIRRPGGTGGVHRQGLRCRMHGLSRLRRLATAPGVPCARKALMWSNR
jgi:hypothetical protein